MKAQSLKSKKHANAESLKPTTAVEKLKDLDISPKMKSERKTRSLSDVLGRNPMAQFKAFKNTDLIGVTFVIESLDWKSGNFGEYALCQITVNGETKQWFGNGTFVTPQLHEIENSLPIRCTMAKQGRAFYLASA